MKLRILKTMVVLFAFMAASCLLLEVLGIRMPLIVRDINNMPYWVYPNSVREIVDIVGVAHLWGFALAIPMIVISLGLYCFFNKLTEPRQHFAGYAVERTFLTVFVIACVFYIAFRTSADIQWSESSISAIVSYFIHDELFTYWSHIFLLSAVSSGGFYWLSKELNSEMHGLTTTKQ